MTRVVVTSAWSDVPHLSEEAKAGLISAYLPHERAARTQGIPSLGSGAIYPVPEDDIICEPFEFPAWYRFVYAMDVGWNRTAAVWGALDPESDVLYLYSEHYRGEAEPPIHAAAIQSRGKWIPGTIDPAARGRNQIDGNRLLAQYQNLGLVLTTANNAVDAGIFEVWTRLSSGRLKVFRTLQNWRTEYRIYRRDEKGKIVKAGDHLMDCTRYLCVSGIALAAMRPPEQWNIQPTPGGRSARHQVEYNPLASMWNPSQGSATGQPLPRNWMPFKN